MKPSTMAILATIMFCLFSTTIYAAATTVKVNYDFRFWGNIDNNRTCTARIRLNSATIDTYSWDARTEDYIEGVNCIGDQDCEGSINVELPSINTTISCPDIPACPACPVSPACTLPAIPQNVCNLTCSEMPNINIPQCPEYNFTRECSNVVANGGFTQRELLIGLGGLVVGMLGMYLYLKQTNRLLGGGFNFGGGGSGGGVSPGMRRRPVQYAAPQQGGQGQPQPQPQQYAPEEEFVGGGQYG